MTDAHFAVLRICRRACAAVRTARTECHAEFFKQVDKTDLHARTADTFHIDKHYAVFEIDAEFGVRAGMFVIEVDSDVCFQSVEDGFYVEIEVLQIDLRQVFHTYLLKVESCLDVEFEAVVHLVGKHEVESETFEQIADAELVVLHVKADFFVVGIDADLRKHRCENALQTVHIEDKVEQFVECETFADVSAVGILHEPLLVAAVRISIERRNCFERSLVGDESVRCACVVVNDQTEVDFDDVRIGHLGVVTSVIAVFRFDKRVADFVVSLAFVSLLFVVCEKNELVVASDTLLRFFANCRVCVALCAGCNVDVADAYAECDEIAVKIDVDCDRRVELQINSDGNVEVEFLDNRRDVGAAVV